MVQFIKDFCWGTFNYRNKGIPLSAYVTTGYHFAKLQRLDRDKKRYYGEDN